MMKWQKERKENRKENRGEIKAARPKKALNKKSLKNGSYSLLVSVIFVAIVMVINLIIGEVPAKYTQVDVSEQQLYTIGEQTQDVLEGLEEDVTIYQIAQNGSEDENIRTLLSRYADESDHIKVELKDPVVSPKFISEYTDDNLSSNSLIVVSGERSKVIPYSNMYESSINYNTYSYETTGFDGEGQITSAISYVTSENLPVVYTISGHGEYSLDSAMEENIQKANMEIKDLNLLSEGEVPEDADCLMILSPQTDITEEEKEALLNYLENGGKAMIFSDYTGAPLPNFQEVLANYGVTYADGIVFEQDSQYYAMQMPYYLIPDVKSTESSSESADSGYYVLMPYAQGIQRTEEVRSTVSVESILSTSESAYSKTNINSTQIEKEENDIEGPFDLGVQITESIDDETETKIVYFSTANILDSQVNQMVSGGNHQLVMESLGWMVSTDESTNVSVPSKSLEVSYLTITEYDAAFWKICTIVLIPGFFLVVGFVVWLKRRKA